MKDSGADMKRLAYWKGHDLSTNQIAIFAWIQHALRLDELSFNSMRVTVDGFNAKDPFMVALRQFIALCGHEYDVIRNKGEKVFEGISRRYAVKMVPVVKLFVSTLARPLESIVVNGEDGSNNTRYGVLASVLTLLGQGSIMRRIHSEWDLVEPFLLTLSTCQSAIASSVIDSDKREKVA